jgi:hypothetical protein
LDNGLISAARFHEAFQVWNSPASYQIPSWISLGESHWALETCIAHGETADVHNGRRARWPTELAIIKLLRTRQDAALLDNEWEVLQALHRSKAPGADTFTMLLPQPIIHGIISSGAHVGEGVSIFRWISGFRYTFDEIIRAYPEGISPRASIWVWRRILEVLSFVHHSGMAHGAVLPSHLLIQENEHGVRLVGYSAAGHLGEKLRTISHHYESIYPQPIGQLTLTEQLDLVMSARCMIALLGGNPSDGSLPTRVPERLAEIVQRIASANPAGPAREDAWTIREELGQIADEVFGTPQFIPIVMPS